MSDSRKQNQTQVKKFAIIGAIAVVAILGTFVALRSEPVQTATSQTQPDKIVAKNVTINEGFYFQVCSVDVDPQKAIGPPENPIVVRQGEAHSVTIAFCGIRINAHGSTHFLKLESGDNIPIRTTKTAMGTATGNVTKGITVTFDKDFIDVPAAKVNADGSLASVTNMTFNVRVNIANNAEIGDHLFFVFTSKPIAIGGYSEIGKPLMVSIRL